jgi:hypothetical protein
VDVVAAFAATGDSAVGAAANEDVGSVADAAAVDDCTMENSIIAKPIIIIRTSLVVCIVILYQVEFTLMLLFNN